MNENQIKRIWDFIAICEACNTHQPFIPATSGKYKPPEKQVFPCEKCQKDREYEPYSVRRNGTVLILEEYEK